MKQRGRFLYQNTKEVIFITFERGTKGVPIESILPECGRGAGFKDFRITGYFDLADLVLAAPKEWAEFCRHLDLTGITKDNPKKVSPPAPDLGFLNLRHEDGMDTAQSVELFKVVAAYWSAPKNTMALEPGLVAALWHSGMTAHDIIQYVQRFTNTDGKLSLSGFKDGRGYQILNTVTQTYRAVKGIGDDTVLLHSDLGRIIDTWLAATRAAVSGTPEMFNSVLHWSDYRRLGLVDRRGAAQIDNVRRLAQHIFSTRPAPKFETVALWVEANLAPLCPQPAAPNSAVRALLKKKRRQARLNRKRGRR